MSTQKTFDPFSIWQDYYKNVENYLGQSMNEQMKTEEFSKWLGSVLDLNLLYKRMTDKSTKQYLDQINLPTREDLANLSSLIVNLDTKVDDLEEKLEENLDALALPANLKKEITSLKKEVKEIDSKLNTVLQFMQANQKESIKSNSKNGSTDEINNN